MACRLGCAVTMNSQIYGELIELTIMRQMYSFYVDFDEMEISVWLNLSHPRCCGLYVTDFYRFSNKWNSKCGQGTPCRAIAWRVCISDMTFTYDIQAQANNILWFLFVQMQPLMLRATRRSLHNTQTHTHTRWANFVWNENPEWWKRKEKLCASLIAYSLSHWIHFSLHIHSQYSYSR